MVLEPLEVPEIGDPLNGSDGPVMARPSSHSWPPTEIINPWKWYKPQPRYMGPNKALFAPAFMTVSNKSRVVVPSLSATSEQAMLQ